MNPRMLASPGNKSELDFNVLLVRMGCIQSDHGTDTDSSAESGATPDKAPMHATGADSGAGTAGIHSPVFPCNEILQSNPCSYTRSRAAQQIAEDLKKTRCSRSQLQTKQKSTNKE